MFLSHRGVHDLKKELGAENSFDGIEQLLIHVKFKIRFTYFGCAGTNCLKHLSLNFLLLCSLGAEIIGLGVIDSVNNAAISTPYRG